MSGFIRNPINLVYIKDYIRKYKIKPKRKGYFFQFRDLKGRFTKFKRNKKLWVFVYKVKRIPKKIRRISRADKWILFRNYLIKYIENIKKTYKGYNVAKIENFYHTSFKTDYIHLRSLYVYKKPVKIPRNKIYSKFREVGVKNHFLIRVYFCFINRKKKKIFFQIRNIGIGYTEDRRGLVAESLVDFNEAYKIVYEFIKKIEEELSKYDYIDFIGLVAWTSYIIGEYLHYEKESH